MGETMLTPLGIDLFCGLGGWTDGMLAEGYDVIGFDIERHAYGDHAYPAQLVLQDVLTLHGSQFRDAALIVASPPCQEYSYRAMPWKRARALPPPDNSLFEACFRIQREACDAAGRHIPLIVENVRGAQKWVGRARWNYGSFYLWGDVPALMPVTFNGIKNGGDWFGSGNDCSMQRRYSGTKQPGIGGMRSNGKGGAWFQDGAARHGSKSTGRKMASAMIAKIPLPLSRYIAATFKPERARRLELVTL
jgi:C-5 cytosine-specific DNA methylase